MATAIDFSIFDALEARRRAHGPLTAWDERLPQELRGTLEFEQIYTSVKIEGSPLTREQMVDVLAGRPVRAKSKWRAEVINYRDALRWVRARAADPAPPTEEDIKALNRLVLRGIEEQAGEYRTCRIYISGSDARFPLPEDVPIGMRAIAADVIAKAEGEPYGIFEAHVWNLFIHAFCDGNGRTSRLLTNLMLAQAGYLPLIVPVEDKKKYFKVLRDVHMDDKRNPYYRFMAKKVCRAYDMLEPKPIRQRRPRAARQAQPKV